MKMHERHYSLLQSINHLTCKQGVCHTVALPCTLKSILRQNKNYGNSNISPCKNIMFKQSSKRNPKSFKDIIINSIITNLKFQHKPKNITFQKSSCKNRPIIITQEPKSLKLLYPDPQSEGFESNFSFGGKKKTPTKKFHTTKF